MSAKRWNFRVLFFEPYPMGLGGNFQTQLGFLQFFAKCGVEAVVVAPIDGVALTKFREMGTECIVLQPPDSVAQYGGAVLRRRFIQRLKAAIDLFRYNLRLVSLLRERKIDVVYANCVRATLSVGFAAKMASRPLLLYVKGELLNPFLDRLVFFLADRILFLSAVNRDDKYPELVSRYHKKIDILALGVDPRVFDVAKHDHSSLRRELGIDPSKLNCVILAQLYRPKGQHVALEALATFVRDHQAVRLYIVGDEVIAEYRGYKTELEALVRQHGLENHVVFTGWRTDALEIVSLMDILIHPSLSEGFALSVLEGMALGLPVIATKVGTLREVITDGHDGFIVEPSDVPALARRWRELIESRELRRRMGSAAKQRVVGTYLLDDKNVRFAEILNDMVAITR